MKKYLFALIALFGILTATNAEIKYLNIYKNGELVNKLTLADIDSVTFHPYHVTYFYVPDTVRLQLPSNMFFTASNSMNMASTLIGYFEPYYATDSAYWQVEDSSIVSISPYGYYQYPLATSQTLPININALQEGVTYLNLQFAGKTKKVRVEVSKAQYQPEDMPADSLLNKIYSRFDQTGDQHPDGRCDFYGFDEGVTSLYRIVYELNEFPADLEAWNWGDIGVVDLQKNNWTANNLLLDGLFRRLYYNIKLCNDYLSLSGTSVQSQAEARFLRAYFYYQLMDLFGNAPIIRSVSDWANPTSATRAELYQFVVSELLAAESNLAQPRQAEQYHADKAAAWLLLSRIYLNAEIYAGKAEYANAATYAKKVIDSSYELADNYQSLFLGDNDNNGAQKEIIFAIRQQGSERPSWGGSKFLVSGHANRTLPSVGTSDIWECIRSKAALPLLFFPNAAQYTDNSWQTIQNSVGAAGGADVLSRAAKDNRVLLCNYYESEYNAFAAKLSSSLDSEVNGNAENGWAILKWNALYADGSWGSHSQFPDNDIPLLRKAEAYLNYAEALVRQGDNTTAATDAYNELRKRAGADQLTSSLVTLKNILDERGREFYSEGIRRTDLVRFGLFQTTDNAYRNIYPIPQSILNVCPQVTQNAGY